MATTLLGIGELIASQPGVHGGQPCVAGTGVTVFWIAHLATREGLSPIDIQSRIADGALSLAQVHAALAYYHRNRAAIEADVAARDADYDVRAAAAESLADR